MMNPRTNIRLLFTTSVFACVMAACQTAAGSVYFAHVPSSNVAPTILASGHYEFHQSNPTSIPVRVQSADGAVVLAHSAIGIYATSPQGMAGGYGYYVGLAHAATEAGTTYKQTQNGSTVPWDIRFPGVVQLNGGAIWPNCINCVQTPNFSDAELVTAAQHYRVAINANPYDPAARTGLIGVYRERMLAHIFAGNNAAQYASSFRLDGGTIAGEIGYWYNAVSNFQAAAHIFADATRMLPDAATFESPLYADNMREALEIWARGLGSGGEAVRQWLQLSYFNAYRDPLSQAYNPGPVLAALDPMLTHLDSHLLLASMFTHVPNYLELDFPSVQAAVALLKKQRDTSIPLGMLAFAGRRAMTQGEIVGEYAPEYVPFLFRDDASSLPTSFENLLAQATELISASVTADSLARDADRTFDTDRNQLTARLDEIFSRYNDQLGELCGLIRGADTELRPDVLGSLLAPEDRLANRPFQSGESPGRIYQQYLSINQTFLEVEAAEQDRRNIFTKAVNARTVGELVANQSENLAQMFLNNGEQSAALERMRGAESARITREIARSQAEEAERQRKRSLWGGVIAAVGGIVAAVAAIPTAGASLAVYATAIGTAGLPAAYNTWSQDANAHGNIALMYKTGDLQAELAEITADIEAQKTIIRAAEAATVQFAQRDQALWKTEEAWQAALLDYERAQLNVLMAEQRLLMQKAEVANLHARVSFLLQEMRKAVVLNTQTINPLARPDYRLWMDFTRRNAEDSFILAQEWLYLASKAAQYKVNSSANVSEIGNRISGILQSRSGSNLQSIRNQLSTDVNTLYLNQGAPTTALSIPLRIRSYVVQNNAVFPNADGTVNESISLFETQLNGQNTLAASDSAWREYLQSRLIFDMVTFSVRLEIPFSTSLNRPNFAVGPGFDPLKVRQNPLFSPTRYSDLINFASGGGSAFGIRINIRGRNLNLDSSQTVVATLRQEGASYMRTRRWQDDPQAFRVWNLKPVEGLVPCSINGVSASPLSTPQFHERSAANDRWVLVIDSLEGSGGNNPALLSQLENITDIEISFAIKGFTN